jgi:hypothetical protein
MAKTYDYIIVLKKKSFELIDNISKLMLLLALAAFIFDSFSTLYSHNTNLTTSVAWLLVSLSATIVAWWIFCGWQQGRSIIPYYRFALMFSAWGWIVLPGGKLIAIVYLVACLLEKPIKVSPEVAFDDEEIVMNSFPKQRFQWDAVNNVVLKDGLLTIDLKNNKVIQKEVDAVVSPEVEAEFNSFCKR